MVWMGFRFLHMGPQSKDIENHVMLSCFISWYSHVSVIEDGIYRRLCTVCIEYEKLFTSKTIAFFDQGIHGHACKYEYTYVWILERRRKKNRLKIWFIPEEPKRWSRVKYIRIYIAYIHRFFGESDGSQEDQIHFLSSPITAWWKPISWTNPTK